MKRKKLKLYTTAPIQKIGRNMYPVHDNTQSPYQPKSEETYDSTLQHQVRITEVLYQTISNLTQQTSALQQQVNSQASQALTDRIRHQKQIQELTQEKEMLETDNQTLRAQNERLGELNEGLTEKNKIFAEAFKILTRNNLNLKLQMQNLTTPYSELAAINAPQAQQTNRQAELQKVLYPKQRKDYQQALKLQEAEILRLRLSKTALLPHNTFIHKSPFIPKLASE